MKYPICDEGEQFIYACRRLAARLDLSETERAVNHARISRGEKVSVPDYLMHSMSVAMETPHDIQGE